MPAPATRVVFLGLDGGTMAVLAPAFERGWMPHLAALWRRSATGALRSSAPMVTPVARTSFLTGCTPPVHGIHEFYYVDADTRTIRANHAGRVRVPIDKTYEQWTKFEEFPKFMHRVLNVKQEDGKVSWDEKIWFSKRHWEGEVTDRRKNRRIAWKTTSGMSHAGVVTFHSLDENLTRVMVTIDFVPQGMIEKMASGLRFVKRAVQGDLARFKAYVELGEAKGLEYKARPAEHDQDDADEDGTKEGDREQRQEAASR